MFLSFWSFHLVYLFKAHMKLNGRKWLDEIEQRNSKKKSKVVGTEWQMGFFCLLTFNSRAGIITRYNFDEVRCFFFTSSIDFMVYLGTLVKYMNNKFQVLINIYVCIRYFIGFTDLENVVLAVRYLPVIW